MKQFIQVIYVLSYSALFINENCHIRLFYTIIRLLYEVTHIYSNLEHKNKITTISQYPSTSFIINSQLCQLFHYLC